MKSITLVALVLVSFGISACCYLPVRPPDVNVKNPTISQVLDEVKGELNAYRTKQPIKAKKIGVCYDGLLPMNLMPTKITLTLKTAAGKENDPNTGLTVPIGDVSLGPSYSGSYSQSRTQTLIVPLTVSDEYFNNPQPVAPGDHPIADAISQFRDEIIRVDHNKTPCLQYSDDKNKDKNDTFKLSLAFDVVNKSAGGIGFKLVGLNLGDKETIAGEVHQTLDMEFKLSGSKTLMLIMPVK